MSKGKSKAASKSNMDVTPQGSATDVDIKSIRDIKVERPDPNVACKYKITVTSPSGLPTIDMIGSPGAMHDCRTPSGPPVFQPVHGTTDQFVVTVCLCGQSTTDAVFVAICGKIVDRFSQCELVKLDVTEGCPTCVQRPQSNPGSGRRRNASSAAGSKSSMVR